MQRSEVQTGLPKPLYIDDYSLEYLYHLLERFGINKLS
jgi:hypothetical protein